jgi:heterodisulfide reductase subunit C
MMIDNSFLKMMEKQSGEKISSCFQCQKCTNGCPVVYAMDYPPHKMVRMVQMGMKEELLKSSTIWVCATCETCAARCPNDIEIATVMDSLRQMYREEAVAGKEKNSPVFHQVFLNSIRRNGRVFELGMVGQYKMKTREYLQDFKLGIEMFKRGRLKLFPQGIKGKKEVRNIFQEAEKQEGHQ